MTEEIKNSDVTVIGDQPKPVGTDKEAPADKKYEERAKFFGEKCQQALAELHRDIVGQNDVVEDTITAMICGGNVLLEGVPGVGKTRLVKSLGRVFDLSFSRIQFTPDLMPADVTGTNVLEKGADGQMKTEVRRGPVFNQIVLADEINRATPKTQSALLEAMQEHTVTASGTTYRLTEPFFVLATENPIEQDGTYALPEAQTDRFMFKLIMTFPQPEELVDIVRLTQEKMEEQANRVLSADELLEMRRTANEIPVAKEVLDYAVDLVTITHPEIPHAQDYTKKYVRFGASPRSAQALISAGKVRALIEGRYNVSFADIDRLAYPVLRHRIKLSFAAVSEKLTSDDIIAELLKIAAKRRR